jgi:hypothetical protein
MNSNILRQRILASKKEPLLLDLYPNASVAYSLRLLRNEYSGNCIEVRRSSDNALQNIGFINGELDTTSLLSFIGSDSGFVRTWYDQSGNNRNATNTTNSQQPRIVFNGVLETENGKPAIINPTARVSTRLIIDLTQSQSLPLTTIISGRVRQLPNNEFNNLAFLLANSVSGPGSGSRYAIGVGNGGFSIFRSNGGSRNTSNYNTNIFVQQGFFKTSEIKGRQNGVDTDSAPYTNTEITRDGNFQLFGGSATETVFSANVSIIEFIIYNTDQDSNRILIENNINQYYNIY